MAESEQENLQKQIDEIEALSSIYEDNWSVVDEAARIFCIQIVDQQAKWSISLQVSFPPEYPSAAPPVYQLNAPWLRGDERTRLSNDLEEIYLKNSGDCILFLWAQKIQDFLQVKSQSVGAAQDAGWVAEELEVDHFGCSLSNQSPLQQVALKESSSRNSDDMELPPMAHGEPITDRRSTFQAHLAPVVTVNQVKLHLQKFYENKKIANATHNIYAYRNEEQEMTIEMYKIMRGIDRADSQQIFLRAAIASTRGHRFKILDVCNVMVVVSRWYGGIQLGPDRFKHINNCARNLLVEQGYPGMRREMSKTTSKSKKPKNKKGK